MIIYWQLFLTYVIIGLLSFGGGHAAIPLIQGIIVEELNWISMEEFTNLLTISEITPGPIAINSSTFVGIRMAGVLGAFFAAIGFITPSCILVSVISLLYCKYKNLPLFQKILGFLRPVIVGLIASAACTILQQVVFQGEKQTITNIHVAAFSLVVVAFYILRKWKWNPILVIFMCGGLNLLLSVIL